MRELARRAWGKDTVVDFQDYGTGDSDISFGTRGILRDIGRREGSIKEKLRSYDVIVDSGAGDSFADIYGMKRFSFMVYARWQASKLKVPVVMGPQTIGPFDSVFGRRAGRFCLNQATLVMSRDSGSAVYAEGLGRPVDIHATDVVFVLPRPVRVRERDVIVNVSGLLWFPNNHVNFMRYREEVVRLIRGLEARDRNVALFAHVINTESRIDDLAAIRSALVLLGREYEVIVPSSLDEAREVLGSASWVVGARMHACLNALSMGTPAVAWSYSRKFAPLMADIGWRLSLDLTEEEDAAEKTVQLVIGLNQTAVDASLEKVLATADARLTRAIDTLAESVVRVANGVA